VQVLGVVIRTLLHLVDCTDEVMAAFDPCLRSLNRSPQWKLEQADRGLNDLHPWLVRIEAVMEAVDIRLIYIQELEGGNR
jgi:hypothetical protein